MRAIYIACLATCLTLPAFAQEEVPETAPAEEAAEEAAAPAPLTGPRLDEIIVTAQKRAENVQDVPLSITAIGGEEIKDLNIDDLNDLTLYAADTEIVASPVFNFIFMRGIGSGFNKGFEQSVATLVDEVYYGRASYLSNGLLDLAGVEVLRGPQGTLMGKNSVAGVLHLKTGDPQDDWAMDAQAMFGELDEKRFRLMVTGPITDSLSFRVALQDHTRDGDIFNTTINQAERNIDRQNARLKLKWEPTAALTLLGTVNYSTVDEDGPGIELTAATPELLLAFQALDPETTGDGFDGKNHSDEPGFAKRENLDVVLRGDLEWRDHTITSISAWGGFEEQWHLDVDFTPVPYLIYDIDEDFELASEELRITSPAGALEYIAGLHVLYTHMNALLQIPLGAINDPLQTLGVLLIPDALQQITDGLIPAGDYVEAERRITNLDQTTTSYAAFGQVTWKPIEKWAFTAGARLQHEVKEIDASVELTGTGLIFPAVIQGSEEFDEHRERKETNFAPKLSVQYYPWDDIMAYATYAKGFKSGGFSDAAINASELEFEDEQSTTWEGGLKTRLLDGAATANFSAFRTDFTNLQLNSFNGQRNIVRNAADAVSQGIEFELSWVPIEQLFVGLAGAWIDAKFIDFKNAVCITTTPGGVGDPEPPCDQSNTPLVYAPEWNGTLNAAFEQPLGNLPMIFVASASASYATETFFSTDHDPIDTNEAGFYIRAQSGLRADDGVWSFMVYLENATDAELYLLNNDVPTLGGAHFGITRESRKVQAEFRVQL